MVDYVANNSVKDTIRNHYLIFSDETLLINNKINEIKSSLKIDESFDFETLSFQDYDYSNIITKIFTPPFVSQKRLVVLRNIEKISQDELKEFSNLLLQVPDSCCLVMIYQPEEADKKAIENFKRICEIFPKAQPVELMPDDTTIHRWIMKKMQILGLKDRQDIVDYLMEEFSDDITGLKNEIQKIENYFFQTRQMGLNELKDISQGLTDCDVYHIANNFFQRRAEIIPQLIKTESYLKTPMILIDALGRALCNYAKKSKDEKLIRYITSELSRIDNRLKTGSDFVELNLEIFFIKNLGIQKE